MRGSLIWMEKNSRIMYLLILLLISCLVFFSQKDRMLSILSKDRPLNILFVLVDNQIVNMVGCYPTAITSTPHIEQLASESVWFSQSFVTNAQEGPSRASILTGMYSHQNGKISNDTQLKVDCPILPGLLQDNGYETALFGKWGLLRMPHGFNHWCILPDDENDLPFKFISKDSIITHASNGPGAITDLAINWMHDRSGRAPFCLFVNYDIPGEKNQDLIDSELQVKGKGETKVLLVRALDDEIGRLYSFLKHNGMLKNTLIIYTSDQGGILGKDGCTQNGLMYDQFIQVPLIVRMPDDVKHPTGELSPMVLNIDHMPTLLEAAQVDIPETVQGQSYWPYLIGQKPADWRKAMYYHYQDYPGDAMVKRHYGIRDDRYKLIHFYYDTDKWEFYNLQEDPKERHNLFFQKEYRKVIDSLKMELEELQLSIDDPVLYRFY